MFRFSRIIITVLTVKPYGQGIKYHNTWGFSHVYDRSNCMKVVNIATWNNFCGRNEQPWLVAILDLEIFDEK